MQRREEPVRRSPPARLRGFPPPRPRRFPSLLAALALAAILPAHSAPRPPNQIFVLVDDMGRDWVGAYGAANATPAFDRLATDGVRFKVAWATPLCTTTRVSMLTGQYPYHNGWTRHYDVPRWGGVGLDPGRFTTLGMFMHRAGYVTAIAGKWQVNDLRPDPHIMQRHGFDEYDLWPGVESGNPASEKRYWDAYLEHDGRRRAHTGEFGPDVVQRFVLDFIRRNRDRPFFLYYPMINVHAPNEPTPLNRAHPPKGEAALYAGMVTYTDRQVAELLRTLDELGLSDHTIVYLAGDNGSSTGGTLHGRPMPAAKNRLSDLGVHVPLIVWGPGIVRRGVVSDALTDFTDLLPTMVEFAGAHLPAPGTFDGHSLVPELTGRPGNEPPRDWVFTEYGNGRAVRDQRYIYDNSGKFYDLWTDPLQQHDLSANQTPNLVRERDHLGDVLARRPPDGPVPFPEFAHAEQLLRDTMAKARARREAAAMPH
ncbi:MAG TPA: sulfatase-like hydrolase/transferase [Opitutaceae bacterium]|nr:sulfatase-like hydrolase/transferase [Opitutaceae bacterium]